MLSMLGWQSPSAFWALFLLAAPIVIHLLRAHHADRVRFPSLRFVRPSQTASVRMRRPSDWPLLILRLTIVALAVCALAGPIVVTPTRLAAWNARVARAVVVDSSQSMHAPGEDGTAPGSLAADAAAAELGTAAFGRRVDAADLDDGVARARAWLSSTPPARREVVVLSDFQRGSFDERVATLVPVTVGLRLVPIGRAVGKRGLAGFELLGTDGVAARTQSIELTTAATAVLYGRGSHDLGGGLRVIPAGDDKNAETRRRDVNALLRAVAVAGTPAPSAEQPIVIRFADTAAVDSRSLSAVKPGWMLRTVLRLREDEVLSKAASSTTVAAMQTTEPFAVVARDRDQKLLVRAAALGQELLLDIAATPDSFFSAVVVRAALDARHDRAVQAEQEIARIPGAVLSAWMRSRPGAPVESDAWRQAESTDARWFWAAALLLMAVEQWLRARSTIGAEREANRAAA